MQAFQNLLAGVQALQAGNGAASAVGGDLAGATGIAALNGLRGLAGDGASGTLGELTGSAGLGNATLTPLADGLAANPLAAAPLASEILQQSAASAPEAVLPTLPVAPTVGESRWAAALGQQALFMASQQISSAQLTLHPPHLGPLQVTLSVQQDQASASFSTAHDAVRQAIENSLPQLRHLFAEAGLTLNQASVQADGGQASSQQQLAQQQAQQQQAQQQASAQQQPSRRQPTRAADAPGGSGAGATIGSVPAPARSSGSGPGRLDTFA